MTKAQYFATEIKKSVKTQDKRFDPNRNITPAIIVEVDGSTSPANRANQTWIDEYGVGSNYSLAWNSTGLDIAGTPVLVSRSPKPPYERVILGVDFSVINQNQGNTNVPILMIPRHGVTHQWPEGNPGRDPVRVYEPALMPLRTQPVTGLFVSVYRLTYRSGSATVQFEGQIVDMTAHVPAAGQVRNVLLYLDKGTNTVLVLAGASVLDNGIIPIPSPDIPDDAIPSSNVKLIGGQVLITEDDITNRREFLEYGESDLPTPTQEGQVLFALTAAEFTVQLPLTGEYGWLVNDDGILMVV